MTKGLGVKGELRGEGLLSGFGFGWRGPTYRKYLGAVTLNPKP